MTKLEQLKAAYEASVHGKWELDVGSCALTSRALAGETHLGHMSRGAVAEGNFIALAHNMMPTLLEAVELLKVAAHALETPGDFSHEELEEQVKGDIAAFLARLEKSNDEHAQNSNKAKVQAALRHVNSFFPDVTQVFYGIDGKWLYYDEDLEAPDFEGVEIDVRLLEKASCAAYEDKGFPCAYSLEESDA